MPIRVEVMIEAVDDLRGYAATGNLPLFFKKLLRLEEVGQDAGLPLGRNLSGWRKIVVGDRMWRIVFRMNVEATIATVWVIGDRDDSACYDEAQRRLAALGQHQPETVSLAAAMFEISQAERAAKQARRRG
jgi:mRNA interferase RelE/StbE